MAEDNNTTTQIDNNNSGKQDNNQQQPDPTKDKKVDYNVIQKKLSPEELDALKKKYMGQTIKDLEKNGKLLKDGQIAYDKEHAQELETGFNEYSKIVAENMQKSGQYEELYQKKLEEMQKKHEISIKDYSNQKIQLESKIKELETVLNNEKNLRINTMLKNTIISKLSGLNPNNPEDVFELIKGKIKYRDDDPNNDIVILDEKGEISYNKDTQKYLSLDEFLLGYAKIKPWLFDNKKPFSPSLGNVAGNNGLYPMTSESIKSADKDQYAKIKDQIFKR